MRLSANSQAILLLTAPLILGKTGSDTAPKLLSSGEYADLARALQSIGKEPADLLVGADLTWLEALASEKMDVARIQGLIGRGFLLSQVLEYWESRAIWVMSRADADYPSLLKKRLGRQAPPVLYGCGDRSKVRIGGLAVVGSRKVDEAQVTFTHAVAELASLAGLPIVSGGAKGIDQAAMQGALESGGRTIGLLVDSLARKAIDHSLRDALMDERLLLLSAYDPSLGFDVGRAMGRNKLIYAFADAALVVASDYHKGGTWTGAKEQLQKHCFLNVYVRDSGKSSEGLEGLKQLGAHSWPNPDGPEALRVLLKAPVIPSASDAPELPLESASMQRSNGQNLNSKSPSSTTSTTPVALREAPEGEPADNFGDQLWERGSEVMLRLLREPRGIDETADLLRIRTAQAKDWLKQLESEGQIERLKGKPTRYRVQQGDLFS